MLGLWSLRSSRSAEGTSIQPVSVNGLSDLQAAARTATFPFLQEKSERRNESEDGGEGGSVSLSVCLPLQASMTDSGPDIASWTYSVMFMSHSVFDCERVQAVHKCMILCCGEFSPLMLIWLCWNPWVRVAVIVHWLFYVREPLQTFKFIIYLRDSCLPCQAAALLLVPACAPVYIFASHKANLY